MKIKLLRLIKTDNISKEYHGETIEITEDEEENKQQIIDKLLADETIISIKIIDDDNKIQEIIKYNELDWEMKNYVSYHYYEGM